MTYSLRLFTPWLALFLVTGCDDSTPPRLDGGPATEATAEATSAPGARNGASPVPISAVQPTGPHGQHDPHENLDPSRLIKVALRHEQEGRGELALQTLSEGLLKYPDDASLYAVRASLRLQNREVSSALSDLERAVDLAPDDARIRVNRAQAYRAFGRPEAAMRDLDVAVQADPDLLPARFNRGALFYAGGEFQKALGDFDRCIEVDPRAPAPYFNRASTYWELGLEDKAMADIQRFLELADNPEWKKSGEDLLERWKSTLAAKSVPAGNGS